MGAKRGRDNEDCFIVGQHQSNSLSVYELAIIVFMFVRVQKDESRHLLISNRSTARCLRMAIELRGKGEKDSRDRPINKYIGEVKDKKDK